MSSDIFEGKTFDQLMSDATTLTATGLMYDTAAQFYAAAYRKAETSKQRLAAAEGARDAYQAAGNQPVADEYVILAMQEQVGPAPETNPDELSAEDFEDALEDLLDGITTGFKELMAEGQLNLADIREEMKLVLAETSQGLDEIGQDLKQASREAVAMAEAIRRVAKRRVRDANLEQKAEKVREKAQAARNKAQPTIDDLLEKLAGLAENEKTAPVFDNVMAKVMPVAGEVAAQVGPLLQQVGGFASRLRAAAATLVENDTATGRDRKNDDPSPFGEA